MVVLIDGEPRGKIRGLADYDVITRYIGDTVLIALAEKGKPRGGREPGS